MNAPSADVPRYAYALAVAAGLLVAPYMYWFAQLLGGAGGVDDYVELWALFWATFAVAYGTLGVAFGLIWPGRFWRWGVWLSAAPLCVVSFLEPGAAFFTGWVLMSVLPSCACAQAAGSYGSKFTAVNHSG